MKHLIIDTESNGLFSYKDPADGPGQPRLAAISMIYLSDDGAVERRTDRLIKPDGWTWDDKSEAAQVNGLTAARLEAEGVSVLGILDEYAAAIQQGYVVVAFNVQHDSKMMRAELRRAGRDDMFMTTPNICVMRPCTDICRILRAVPRTDTDFKFPKLAEAMAKLGLEQQGAHTAGGDADSALAIFRKLREMGMCPEPGIHTAKKRPAGSAPRRAKPKVGLVSAGDEIPS